MDLNVVGGRYYVGGVGFDIFLIYWRMRLYEDRRVRFFYRSEGAFFRWIERFSVSGRRFGVKLRIIKYGLGVGEGCGSVL